VASVYATRNNMQYTDRETISNVKAEEYA